MVDDMEAMFSCIFNFCDERMCIATTCIVPGATSGLNSLINLREKSYKFAEVILSFK